MPKSSNTATVLPFPDWSISIKVSFADSSRKRKRTNEGFGVKGHKTRRDIRIAAARDLWVPFYQAFCSRLLPVDAPLSFGLFLAEQRALHRPHLGSSPRLMTCPVVLNDPSLS